MIRNAAAVALLTALSIGCGDSATDPEPTSGIAIVSGASRTDTIGAVLSAPLVVRVLSAEGNPLPGIEVRFTRRFGPQGGFLVAAPQPVTEDIFGNTTRVVTNAAGEAKVFIALGLNVGDAWLRIAADGHATDSARFTIRPGAADTVLFERPDTVLPLGGRGTMKAYRADRLENRVAGTVLYESGGAGVNISSSGSVTGTQLGVYNIFARAVVNGRTLRGSAAVGVLPDARLVWTDAEGLHVGRILSTPKTRLLSTNVSSPAWDPVGDRLVYNDADGGLWIKDLTGADLKIDVPGIVAATWAQFSRDGAWIYFEGRHGRGSRYMYRVRPNGQDLAQVTPDGEYWMLSPSPDASSFVFVTINRVMRIIDLASGVSRMVTPDAHTPRWSPDGTMIAFVTRDYGQYGAITIILPDASGRRVIGIAEEEQTLSWSPDSRFVIVGGGNVMVVADAVTGVSARLLKGGKYPAWEPAR